MPLTLRNVEVVYNKVILVIRGISFEVGDGQVVTLLGANGAGKTTTLKAISGLLHVELGEVTHGTIELDGVRIDKWLPERIAKMGIIQILEGRRLFPHLSVEENLMAGAYIRRSVGNVKRDLDMVYDYFPKLRMLRHAKSGYLSGGEQQMLVVGRGLMAKPRFMLVDEASLGLAPLLVAEIYDTIKRLNTEEKVGFLCVEQNAKASLAIASYGYVMENGRIVLDAPADKLRDNEDVKEFYLGLSAVGQKKSYREAKHYKRRKRWLG